MPLDAGVPLAGGVLTALRVSDKPLYVRETVGATYTAGREHAVILATALKQVESPARSADLVESARKRFEEYA
ncbi:hypothetical protein ACWGBX_31890 [Streptomyces sp. NPDC055037]